MTAVLMSVRADVCKTIFERWTKRLEYRSRFNKDFDGVIYVYESGADGSHKVIGTFKAGHVVRDSADDGISEEDEEFLSSLDSATLEQYDRIVRNADVMYAIEITGVHKYETPMALQDFCAFMGIRKIIKHPPQSWQYVEAGSFEPIYTEVQPAEPGTAGENPTDKFFNDER